MITCLPKEAQSIVQSLVVRKRLEAALSLACQHKGERQSTPGIRMLWEN